MNTTYTLFPWKKVKWMEGNNKYEIFSSTLEDASIEILLPHCIGVKGKVKREVSVEKQLGPSLFKVFPRTLDTPLLAVWDFMQHSSGTDFSYGYISC
jgi:hypothetical protein